MNGNYFEKWQIVAIFNAPEKWQLFLKTPNSCHQPKFLISIFHSMLYLTQSRGEAEFAEVISLLSMHFFTKLSEILLVMVFFSADFLNFLCALRLSASLRETFN